MLSHLSRIAIAENASQLAIEDLSIRKVGGQSVLYASTRRGGVIEAWSLGETPSQLGSTLPFAGKDAAGFTAGIAFVETPSGLAALYGGGVSGALVLTQIGTGGTPGASRTISGSGDLGGDLVHAITVELPSGVQLVFGGMAGAKGIAQLTFDAQGGFKGVAVPQKSEAGDVAALAHTRIGNADVLFTVDRSGQGITAWRIGKDGALSLADTETLWIDQPTAVQIVAVLGQVYVVVAAAGSSSISVASVDGAGNLALVDHIIDDRGSRFDQVSVLEVVEHAGAAYIVAGGSDGGISILRVLPGGRLLSVAHAEGSLDHGMDGVAAIAVTSTSRGLEIFVSSLRDKGVAHLLYTPPAGNLILAGKKGGAGDDIIMDSAASDVLSGGAGADVFVLSADGKADTITDFELGRDRIDISAWGMIRSLDQLSITRTANGFKVTYGSEVLNVHAANGRPIDQDDLQLSDLIDLSHFPVIVPAVPEPAPDPPPPTLPENLLRGTGGNDRITAPARSTVIEGLAGNDTLTGNKGNDTIFGGSGNDVIFGGAGNDSIMGDDGNDLIEGGSGRDWLYGGSGQDTIRGGDDSSRIYGGDGDDYLYGGRLNDRMYGGAGNDHIFGSRGNDLLYGGAGNDIIYGASGNDQLYGGLGADTLYGSLGRDRLFGGDGDDLLYGEDGADRLVGDAGNDTLYGGDGNDAIFGGDGNDLIDAGMGADYIMGGAGADIFLFRSIAESPPDENRDKILDFVAGEDRLDLSRIDGRSDIAGHQDLTFIGHNAFSAPGQLRIFESGGHTVVQVDVDGDGKTDMNIVLMNSIGLTIDDFIL